MAEDKRRKVAFYLSPETHAGDKFLCDELEALPVKERGRMLRVMLLAGAALRQLDGRAPGMLSETLSDKTTVEDLASVLRVVLPDAFAGSPVSPAEPTEPETTDEVVSNNLKGMLDY